MSTAASRVVRIATMITALVLGVAAATATIGAAADTPVAAESCGSFAINVVAVAGAPGPWGPLLPHTTTPNEDGTCPAGYEAGYEATVCTYDADGNVVACAVQTICVPVQQGPQGSLSDAG